MVRPTDDAFSYMQSRVLSASPPTASAYERKTAKGFHIPLLFLRPAGQLVRVSRIYIRLHLYGEGCDKRTLDIELANMHELFIETTHGTVMV